jgi:hypothetical protein
MPDSRYRTTGFRGGVQIECNRGFKGPRFSAMGNARRVLCSRNLNTRQGNG